MPKKSKEDRKVPFKKIITHPDKKELVKMLMNGLGVRKVANFLKEKYPDDKSKHISTNTLQDFRTEKLNLEKEVIKDLKKIYIDKKLKKDAKKVDTIIKKDINKLPSYKKKLNEVANYHVDLQRELKELLMLIKSRIEVLFDKASRGETTINEEANLQRYFQSWTTAIERWAKYIEKIADKTVETTNVNITVIEDQMSVIREAIMESLKELEPDVALKFLNNLNNKMSNLSYRKNDTSFGRIKKDVEVLTTKVEGFCENDDE